MIITIASFKGGVGKTTTAIHLACYLVQKANTLLALAMDVLLQTVEMLNRLGSDRYGILLTIIPPAPRQTGKLARDALKELPTFKQGIRRLAADEKAALEGIPVYEVKGDKMAGTA